MFKIFKRKTREPPNAGAPVFHCNHIWKDFPWYMTSVMKDSYADNLVNLETTIHEPYVCALCKERKDILLLKRSRSNIHRKDIYPLLEEFQKECEDNLKPRAIVEDMINDYILVDREKLEIFEKIRNGGTT